MMSLHYKPFKGDSQVNTSVVPVSFVLSTKAIDEEFMFAMIDMAVKTYSMIRMSIVVLLQRALGKEGTSQA